MEEKQLIENPEEIVLSTHDEVDQILGNPPGWILRWGLTLVFIAVILFSLIAWMIKYPDIIQAQITLLTEHPSIPVMAKTSGKINQLFVANNQTVKENEVLALLDNPTSLEDVNILESFLKEIENIQSVKKYTRLNPIDKLALGNLQPSYAALTQKINDYKYFLKQTGLFKKIHSLEAQIDHNIALTHNLKKQKNKLEQELKIAKKNVSRNRQLNENGTIPDTDLEKIETQYLQHQRQLDVMEGQIVRNDITIEQLNAQILDLSQNRKNGRSDRELNIKQDIQRIKSEIEVWKQTYIITAPIAGKVSFSKIWTEQQFVKGSEEVLTIVPIQSVGKIIGKAKLPISNSGKVKTGQTVNISLDGFPYQEYGVIKSTVEHIALIPKEDTYLLEIKLPDSLITTYDKSIPFRQEMRGTANIITEDRRVLERIFDRVTNLLKNR